MIIDLPSGEFAAPPILQRAGLFVYHAVAPGAPHVAVHIAEQDTTDQSYRAMINLAALKIAMR